MATSSLAKPKLHPRARLAANACVRRAVLPLRHRTVSTQAAATFTGVPRWPLIFEHLTQKQVHSITPEEAQERMASGEWALVDVRLREQHVEGAPEGAVSVPVYETIDFGKADFRKLIKAVAYKSNGVNPVDPNPSFAEEMRAAAAGKRGVIVLCEAGGTLKPSINFPEGKASRSLQAAYRVVTEGLAADVAHLERGLYGWYQAGLPIRGQYKPDIGRSPMAAAEPMLKRTIAESGYEMRPDDKPMEPASKGLWPW